MIMEIKLKSNTHQATRLTIKMINGEWVSYGLRCQKQMLNWTKWAHIHEILLENTMETVMLKENTRAQKMIENQGLTF